VYVNNTFYPTATTSGTYAHIVDYIKGRVIFNSSVTGTVSCEYTMRDIGVYTADSIQFKTIMDNYEEKYHNLDTRSPSGMAQVLKENRAWLPSVFVEIQDRDHTPLQLGGGELANFNIFYHVFSDTPKTSRTIVDILNDQEGRTLDMFDINSSPYPFEHNGTLASGALTYKQLSNRNGAYYWRSAFIEKSTGRHVIGTDDAFRGECRHKIIFERYGFG
jgi:hypothetical protein